MVLKHVNRITKVVICLFVIRTIMLVSALISIYGILFRVPDLSATTSTVFSVYENTSFENDVMISKL